MDPGPSGFAGATGVGGSLLFPVGMTRWLYQPPSGRGPALSRAPTRAARSAMPDRPCPSRSSPRSMATTPSGGALLLTVMLTRFS